MSTTVLLIILAVCGIAVMAAAGYASWYGFRLARTAARTAGKFSAASAQLSQNAAQIQARAAEIAGRRADIAATLEDLRVSMIRLQLVLATFAKAVRPLVRVTAMFEL